MIKLFYRVKVYVVSFLGILLVFLELEEVFGNF